MKNSILKLVFVFFLLGAFSVQAQTMTFNSGATEPGFTISGFTHDAATNVLFPTAPNVNSVITISKNQSCFNATSFKVSCFNASFGNCGNAANGVWRVWSNNGDQTTFVVGSNQNQIVTLGWNDIKWVKIQLDDPGTANPNNTFDFDDFVYNVPVYTPASTPTVTANPNPACPNSDIALNISGNLNNATKWFIYSTSCGTNLIGSTAGSTFTVSPNTTTTYYIKGIDEKGCAIDGDCGTVEVVVGDTTAPIALCKPLTIQLDASGNASISAQSLSANSSGDFSDTQGNNNWTYGTYSAFDTAGFTQLPNWTGFVWNNPNVGAILDFPQLDANGGHPQFEGLKWAVRRWTSDYTGEITLSGDFYDRDGNCGDGANVRIFQNGTQVYEYLNIPTNSIPYSLNLNVTNGDIIDFAIDPKFDAGCDDTHFVANISEASSINNGSYDNCGAVSFSLSQSTFTCADVGTNTVTLTVIDGNGNSSTCNAQVTIEDNIPPIISCPSNITTEATSASGAIVNYTQPTRSDNCGTTLTLTAGLSSGLTFPIGVTTVTYAVTDDSNNTAQCTFTVTVTGIAPDIQCPGDITAFSDPSTCGASVTFAATDTLGNPASTITYSQDPGTVFPVGTTLVTATATNIIGSSECMFNVTVTDNEAPVITGCPTEFTIVLDGSGNGGSIDLADFTNAGVSYTDNCDIDTVEVSTNAFDCSDVSSGASGTSVWINEFHYDNASGDVGEFVEVAGTAGLDLTGYSIVLYNGSNGTVYNTINISASIDDEGSGFGALDFQLPANGLQNGDPDGLALVDNEGTVLEFISYEGSFTATAGPAAGITSTNIGVSETSSTPIGFSLQLNGTGSSGGDFSWSGPSAESPGSLNAGQTVTASGPQVTLTVTDVNGNASTCVVPVTVTDDENPVITGCPTEFTIVLDGSGNGGSIDLADFTNAGVSYSDNCGIDTVEVSPNSFDCSDVSSGTSGASVWINEFHYDNSGTDTGEFIEVAGTAGFDLTGYSIVLYNGSNGTVYSTINISVSIDDEGSGFGALDFQLPVNGLQNGAPDGIALVDDSDTVLEFISYEGSFTASNGPASGITSTDVGVSESGSALGESLQLSGTGNTRADFIWSESSPESPGSLNAGQTITDGGLQVTLTVTDINGNVSTCTVPVKVEDNQDPVITGCPTEFTIVLDGLGNGGSIDLADFTNAGVSYSDNCGIDTVEVSANSFDCSDVSSGDAGASVWINEFHYDNSGTDAGEFVEVAGTAGFDLTGYSIALYNGSNGTVYNTINISASIDDEGSGFGALDFQLPANGLQNGAPDGLALVDNGGTVLEFISYEGSFTATAGPASGMTSSDIGVSETSSTLIGESLQLTGTGSTGTNFTWSGPSAESPGDLNSGQTITTGGPQVTLTVTDVNGNVSTCTVPVTVEDNENPVANCPTPNASYSADTGNCDATLSFSASPTDNCGIQSTVYSVEGTEIIFPYDFPVGSTTVDVLVTDVNSNTDSCSFVVNVTDDEAPIINCQDITVQLDEDGLATIDAFDIINGSELTSSDNWLGYVGILNNAGDFQGGYGAILADITSNFNGSNQLILQPNFQPQNASNTNIQGNTYIEIDNMADTPLRFSGSTDDNTLTSTHNAFAFIRVFNSSGVFLEEIDDALVANSDFSVQYNVHPDAFRIQYGFTVQGPGADSNDEANLGSVIVSNMRLNTFPTDACGIDEVTIDNDSFSCDNLGANTVNITVTDINGNTSNCSATVTIIDTIAPVVDCLSVEVQLDEFGNGSILESDIDGDSTDNCGIASITLSQTDFTCSDINGDLDELIISEYVDGTGNNDWIELFNGTGDPIILGEEINGNLVSYYSINIYTDGSLTPTTIGLLGTIGDRETFKIAHSDAANIAGINSNFGDADIVFDGNDAIALANNGVAVDVIGVIGNNPGSGWTSTSNSTNGTTLVRSETVEQGNVSTFLTNFESEWIQFAQNDVSNLGDHDIIIVNEPNNVILTVTDTSGNVSTCEGSVTVFDSVEPEALCQNVTVTLNEDGIGFTSAQAVDNGSNDACGIRSLELSQTQFTCADIGANPVTLTVTDSNGNVSTCTATVTVLDEVEPVVECNPITVQLDSFGNYILTDYTGQGTSDVDAIGAGSTDACGIASMTVSPNSFTCADVGSPVTVTLTVTDNNGNVSTCQTTVTVEDSIAPEALCQPATVQLDANGEASITITDIDNGSNDACGIASRSLDITEFTCDDVGSPVTVELTVTDNNGNVSTCEALVTVEGITPTVSINDPEELPEFCQGAVLVLTTTATNATSYLWSNGETTESIEVGPQGGTFTVTVTSATNCSVSDTFTVAAFDASTLLSAYTILAEEEVFLHGSNLVQSGGIGATDANGLIKLHQATNVIEFGRAANIVLNQGSTIVTPIYQPAEIPFPDFVFNDQSNNASPDVTINTNQSTTLGGSVYGTITVKQGATVTFSQSDIYIDELRTFDGAAIEFSGCANVFINTKFKLAQNGTINANGNNVVMYINEDVQIEKGSYVRARMHSNGNELLAKGPNGNSNNSGDLTQMIGLFIAKKVHGNKNVIWNADDLCAPCPISPTNAPIIGNVNDFGVDLEVFDVLTWPNPSDTEFNVQLKTLDLYSESYIEVFDISNKLVFTGSFKPQEVYAFGKELEGGVYIVKVQQGQKSKTIRLVKY